MKVDIKFYMLLVETLAENCTNATDVEILRDKLHILLDRAAETAKNAKEAGL